MLTLSVHDRQAVQVHVDGHLRTLAVVRTTLLARSAYVVASGSVKVIGLHLKHSAGSLLRHPRAGTLNVLAVATVKGGRAATRPITLERS